MKTFNQKFAWGFVGALIGAILGYLICAFIAGTFDPFSFRIMYAGFSNDYTPERQYGVEGLARFGWVAMIGGFAWGGAAFAVYLVGKK
jgi:hypothetical protein